ncbi:MAG: hypothetical protein ACRD12_13615, partial [Acidimicrobiales bacterium]
MTAVEVSPVVEASPPDRHPGDARVAFALARVEARRLTLTPPILAVFALLVLIGAPGGLWPEVANLRALTINAGFDVLPIAAAALVGSTFAALRARRHGT